MRRLNWTCIFLLGSASCNPSPPVQDGGASKWTRSQQRAADMVSPQHGHVYLARPVAKATVRVLAYADGANEPQELARTETNFAGDFVLDLAAYEGPAIAEASWSGSEVVLRAPIDRVQLGAERPALTLSPITTLATAYAVHLATGPEDWAGATAKATEQLNDHFGGLDALALRPTPWARRVGHAKAACDVGPEATYGLLLASLWEQGSRPTPEDQENTAEVRFARYLAALVRDIGTDGRFNGRAANAQAIKVAGHLLGEEALRNELSQQILALARAPDAAVDCADDDLQLLVDRLRASSTPLFEVPTGAEAAPEWLGCTLTEENGTRLADHQYTRGKVIVACTWQGGAEPVEARCDANGAETWIERLDNAQPRSMRVLVHTDEFEDTHPSLDHITLVFRASDAQNLEAKKSVQIRFKNKAPTLDILKVTASERGQFDGIRPVWRNHTEQVVVQGYVSHDVKKMNLFANGGAVASLDAEQIANLNDFGSDGFTFRMEHVDAPCVGMMEYQLNVEDFAGNNFARKWRLACTNAAPHIAYGASAYEQDFGVPTGWPTALSVGWHPEENLAPVFHKYMHNLDLVQKDPTIMWPDKGIPALVFSASQVSPDDGPPLHTKVMYRYLLKKNGETQFSVKRGFDLLAPYEGQMYNLPLSYQNLLPKNLVHGNVFEARLKNFVARSSEKDLHAIDVVAINDAGLEYSRRFLFRLDVQLPPVQVQDFAFTPAVKEIPFRDFVGAHNLGKVALTAKAHWPMVCSEKTLYPCPQVRLTGGLALQTKIHNMWASYRFVENNTRGKQEHNLTKLTSHLRGKTLCYHVWDGHHESCDVFNPPVRNFRNLRDVAWMTTDLRPLANTILIKEYAAKMKEAAIFSKESSVDANSGQEMLEFPVHEDLLSTKTFAWTEDVGNGQGGFYMGQGRATPGDFGFNTYDVERQTYANHVSTLAFPPDVRASLVTDEQLSGAQPLPQAVQVEVHSNGAVWSWGAGM